MSDEEIELWVVTSSSNSIMTSEPQNGASKQPPGEAAHILEERDKPPGSSYSGIHWLVGVVLLVNACSGTKLLEFPHLFAETGGIYVSCIVELFTVLVIVGGIHILVKCCKLDQSSSFPAAIKSSGTLKLTYCFSAFLVVLFAYGLCSAALTVIGDQWDKLFLVPGLGRCDWHVSKGLIVGVGGLILVLPLCFTKKIQSLLIPSIIGVCCVLYCAILVIVKFFQAEHKVDDEIKWSFSQGTLGDAISFIPDVCLSYKVIVFVFPIYHSISNQSTENLTKFIATSLACLVVLYSVIGVMGYLIHGNDVETDVLLSFDTDLGIKIGIVVVVIKMVVTYPMAHYVGRQALDYLWIELMGIPDSVAPDLETTRRVVISLFSFTAVIIIVVLFPSLTSSLPFVRGIVGAIGFNMPGVCLLQRTLKEDAPFFKDTKHPKAAYVFLLSVATLYIMAGTFLVGMALTQMVLNQVGVIKLEHVSVCHS